MTPQDLLKLDDDALSEYLEAVSLDAFRAMLKGPPLPEWYADNDGNQWVVRKGERIDGYYPKFHQAVSRIYEGMVAEKVVVIDSARIEDAVAQAIKISGSLEGGK